MRDGGAGDAGEDDDDDADGDEAEDGDGDEDEDGIKTRMNMRVKMRIHMDQDVDEPEHEQEDNNNNDNKNNNERCFVLLWNDDKSARRTSKETDEVRTGSVPHAEARPNNTDTYMGVPSKRTVHSTRMGTKSCCNIKSDELVERLLSDQSPQADRIHDLVLPYLNEVDHLIPPAPQL